jgi:hypothetical protein
VLRCHSHTAVPATPAAPRLRLPYGYGDVDLVGTPTAPPGEDSAMAVEMMPAKQAVTFLGDSGQAMGSRPVPAGRGTEVRAISHVTAGRDRIARGQRGPGTEGTSER